MKHFFVLAVSVGFIGCASAAPKDRHYADETKVQPVVASSKDPGSDKRNDWKYSSDCKTWVDRAAFQKQITEAKSPSQFTYEQLTTTDPSMSEQPRLIQYDSKKRIVVGDNMTVLTQFTEVKKPKDHSHNPQVPTQKEFMGRSFFHQMNSFSIASSRLDASELDSTLGWLRDSRVAGWKVSMSQPAGVMTLVYSFSALAEDKANQTSLSSRYSALICTKESCKLAKSPTEFVGLTKKSLELAELKDLSGFNPQMLSEIDQMCAKDTKKQFVKLIENEQGEYAKSCKIILSDDAVVRNWTTLCNSYREQLKPIAAALFN